MAEQPPPYPPRARYSGLLLVLLVAALLAANVVWIVRNCGMLRSVGPGQPAPAFDLPTLGGDRVRLADLRGRVVLLDFWSVTCGPCWAGLKHLQRLHTRYAGKPLTILAIHVRGRPRDRARAAGAAAELRLRFPVLLDTHGVSDKYTVRVLPTTVLVGKDGRIRKVWRGVTDTSTLAAAVDDALAR